MPYADATPSSPPELLDITSVVAPIVGIVLGKAPWMIPSLPALAFKHSRRNDAIVDQTVF